MVRDVSLNTLRALPRAKSDIDTCIGYNTLYVGSHVPESELSNGETLPEGQRLWSWLILTDDGKSQPKSSRTSVLTLVGTIVSIQENPFPRQPGPLTDVQQKILDIVRRNVRSVFKNVSKQHSSVSENDSLVTIRVRHFSDVGPDQANIKPEDGPSLLFYYIFDDWVSSYGLIAQREHQYGKALEELVSPTHLINAKAIAVSLTVAESIDD